MKDKKRVLYSYPRGIPVGAFRYALGRMSYIVGVTVDWLIRDWELIQPEDQIVIKRDLANALEEGNLGMSCDKKDWQRLALALVDRP